MKYLALIQARCGSSRLPNKIMKEISGKPEIQWVIERVQRSRLVEEVMVITSIEKNNLPLVEFCSKNNVRVYIGSENDVLERYYQAAKLIKPEYVIRITADCPVFDWRYLDMAIKSMNDDTDYVADLNETLPDGLDVEIIRFSALETAYRNAVLASEREHVTMYIKNNKDKFKIQNFECPIKNIGNKRWTLDEYEDFILISDIYEHFIGINKADFVTEDILRYLEENPQIEKTNQKIIRNEGLAKSLANDYVIEGDN